jgi:hypothetical protein
MAPVEWKGPRLVRIHTLTLVGWLVGSPSLAGCRTPTDRESVAPVGGVAPESPLSSGDHRSDGSDAGVDERRSTPAEVERQAPTRAGHGGPRLAQCKLQPVESVCGERADCALIWERAGSLARDACTRRGTAVELFEDCDGYRVLRFRGADTSFILYYDLAGKLVTLYESGMIGERCFGLVPPISHEKLRSCAKQDCRSLR